MKIYALLFCCSACWASEREVHITNNNNITLTNTQAPRKILRPGPKHPDVEEAHAKAAAQREQDERDAMTCCCFIRIKKHL